MSKVIIINSDIMGAGSEELGKILIGSFLRKLQASDVKPDKIVIYNTGVKLLAKGSEVLDALLELHKGGIDIVACGTCVNYFKLKDMIIVGRVSTMPEIISILMSAECATI